MKSAKHFIFIINGHNGVGKDTFVGQVHINATNFRVVNMSSIDCIKALLYGNRILRNGDKSDKARKLMADFKEALDNFNDYTHKDIISSIVRYYASSPLMDDIIFIHCREPQKISHFVEDLQERYGKTAMIGTILVRRYDNDVSDVASNDADKHVEDYNYDMYIDGTGDLNFINESKKFIETLEGINFDEMIAKERAATDGIGNGDDDHSAYAEIESTTCQL